MKSGSSAVVLEVVDVDVDEVNVDGDIDGAADSELVAGATVSGLDGTTEAASTETMVPPPQAQQASAAARPLLA